MDVILKTSYMILLFSVMEGAWQSIANYVIYVGTCLRRQTNSHMHTWRGANFLTDRLKKVCPMGGKDRTCYGTVTKLVKVHTRQQFHGLYGKAVVAKLHSEGAHHSLMARTGLMKVHIRQCFCIDEALWEQM